METQSARENRDTRHSESQCDDWATATDREYSAGANEAASSEVDNSQKASKSSEPGNDDVESEIPKSSGNGRGRGYGGRGYRRSRRGGRSWNQQRYDGGSVDSNKKPEKSKKRDQEENNIMVDGEQNDAMKQSENSSTSKQQDAEDPVIDKNGKVASDELVDDGLVIPPPVRIRVSADKSDILSIYYICDLRFGTMQFWSIEQAYQWFKAISVGSKEAAFAVLSAAKGTMTANIANQYFVDADWNKWQHLRIPVMKQLLRAKARCCKQFAEELRNSGEAFIAVVIKDDKFWGIGDGKGLNKLGNLLMELRSNLDEALNADPEEDEKIVNLSETDSFRSHEMTVLLIGDSQLSGISCKNLVPGVIVKKRIVPSIEETHEFIENEDMHDYELVVLHLLSHDVLARCREDLLDAMLQLTDAVVEKMKAPKVVISLAIFPIFSREKEYSKLADDINNVLFMQGKSRECVSFRSNGLRLSYDDCFTDDGMISKKAERLLQNNLADTIHHHLLYRKPSPSSHKTSKASASSEIHEGDSPVESQDKDGGKQSNVTVAHQVQTDNKLAGLPGAMVIVSEGHELSNLYPCDLYLYGIDFWSGEQAYQWCKATKMGNKKAASEIYDARHASQARDIASRYFRKADMRKWHAHRIAVMRQLLRAKARCCKPFVDKLRASGDGYIVVVIKKDDFWGIGDGKGKNIMGSLLMELRNNLDEALGADPDEDGKMIDFSKKKADKYEHNRQMAKVLVIGDSQLSGLNFNNLLEDVDIFTIIKSSREEVHQSLEKEDISGFDATVLHLLSSEMVSNPKDEVIKAVQNFTSAVRERMAKPRIIISLAIYPRLSPDDEYSKKADIINTELFELFKGCTEVSFRRNGLHLEYEQCFTAEGELSHKAEELLKKNLADTIYHHLFVKPFPRKRRWRPSRGGQSY